MRTKPRGIWANFVTTCTCGADLTVTNGKVEPHQCERVSLDDIRFPEPGAD